jgi:hypothetical protein
MSAENGKAIERRGFREGQRVYWVHWKNGIPYIEGGLMEVRSVKRPYLTARFPSSRCSAGYTLPYHATIKEAVAYELVFVASVFGRTRRKPEGQPWDLARVVTRVWRLYRKLQKHHLV